uniref:Uncharacterized protein n=1 Tax=Timema genevievae TaxID=629358 RepID=A0A7R9PL56_TIMGE|nr:unnamed protein product [Timema genevievae]
MPLLSTDEVIVNVGVVVVSGVPSPPQSLPGQEQEEPSTPEGRETRSGSEGGESSVSSHVAEGVFPSLPDGALLQLGLLPVNERSIRWVPVMSKISAPALALISRLPLPVDIVCRKLDSLGLMTGIADYNRWTQRFGSVHSPQESHRFVGGRLYTPAEQPCRRRSLPNKGLVL